MHLIDHDPAAPPRPSARRALPYALIAAGSLAAFYMLSGHNYLLFHGLVEGVAIAVACGVFMLTWNSRRMLDNGYLMVVGIAYLFVAAVDLLHTMAYEGMGVFPDHGANLATELWVGARYLEAATLLVAPLAINRARRPWTTLGAFALVTLVLLAAIFGGWFPDCGPFNGQLTPFKIGSEIAICVMILLAAALILVRRAAFDPAVLWMMLGSMAATIAAELLFTLYRNPDGIFNVLGHLFKLLSFLLIYWAVIVTGLTRPYRVLYRRMSQSEERYRALFRNMTEGFALHEIITDDSGRPCDYRFVDVNPGFERLTGLKRDEVVGRRVLEVLPQTEPQWIETFGRVALTGEPAHVEDYSVAIDRWYSVYGYRPAPGQFAVVFTDVTERKKARQTLEDNERRFRVVADFTYDWECWHAPDGALLYVSPSCKRITGHTREQFYENPDLALEIVHPADREKVRKHLDKGEGPQGMLQTEFRIVRPDGGERWIGHICRPIYDENGDFLGRRSSNRDITEAKEARTALRESRTAALNMMEDAIEAGRQAEAGMAALASSEARLRMTLGAARMVSFEWDIEHDVVTRLVPDDLHPDHPLAPPVTTLDDIHRRVHPHDLQGFSAAVRDALEGRTDEYENEYRMTGPKGAPVWIYERGRVERDNAGRPLHLVGLAQDITARKEAERALKEINETLEERVSERTQEVEEQADQLRALAGQLSQAEQRERKRLAQVLHDHVQQLIQGARMHLARLKKHDGDALQALRRQVDDILEEAIDVSRSLAMQLSPPVLTTTGLAGGLRWLVTHMRETSDFDVDLDFEPRAEPALESTRYLLFECVRELLLNAVKHADVSEARVSVLREGGRIQVTVTDRGAGFDPEVFTRRRADDQTFGLFSIRERLTYMGGGMDVQTAPGRGTTITLTAPADPSPREAEDEPAGDAAPVDIRRKPDAIRLILVDDHQIMREGLARLLRFESDMEIVGQASDGPEAIALADELKPDVVIMDVNLGAMTGMAATRRILKNDPSIKVIALSMHRDADVAESMGAAGAVAYLTKGGPYGDLLSVIRNVVGDDAKDL